MKRKQTAVDLLYEFVLLKLTNEQQTHFEGLFAQAKATEKEQIEKAYMESLGGGTDPRRKEMFKLQAKKYYNETYGDESASR